MATPTTDTKSTESENGDSTSSRPTPPVTVVLVAHQPGDWFDETLASIAAQDYPRLRTVVFAIDGEPSIGARVSAHLPQARIVPLMGTPTFSAAANQVLTMPNPTPLMLLCHDDVVMAPDTVSVLVDEGIRSNAGVVGPKIVDWDHPERLLEVGLGVDKTGVISPTVEPGEVDQEQHDAVRDVFAISSTVMLIRSDLFKALGGFDTKMTGRGEDVDLCWRARIAGARILVAPSAGVRHRETDSRSADPVELRRLQTRNQARMVMSNYGAAHRLRVMPQAVIAAGVSAGSSLVRGNVGEAKATLSGWAAESVSRGRLRARRRRVSATRKLPDSEVRRFQVSGFENLNRVIGGEGTAEDASGPQWRERLADLGNSIGGQILIGVWIVTAAVLLFGSRGLIGSGIPVFREFVQFPDSVADVWDEFLRGARGTGLAATTYAPTTGGVVGVLGVLFFGQLGLLRTVLIAGMLFVGAFGMVRLMSPFRSRVAQIFSPWVYLALPVPYNALVNGSWSALALFGALPWLVRWWCRAAGIRPYGTPDSFSRARMIAGGALVVGLAGAAAPSVVIIAGLVLVMWIIGTLAIGRADALGSFTLVVLASVALGAALNAPWWFASITEQGWDFIAGDGYPVGQRLGLVELFRLQTGPHGGGVTAWGVHVVAVLGLLLAQGDRLIWAMRGWMIALGSLAVVWFTQIGYIDVRMPMLEVLLVPAAFGLAIPAVMALIAFERDLSSYRFGYRQALPVVAAICLLMVGVARVGASIDGRWDMAEGGFETAFRFIEDGNEDVSRILWVGAPGVLPVDGWDYGDSVVTVTDPHVPALVDRWVPADPDGNDALRSALDVARNGGTNRLGRLLSPFGIRYVIGVEQTAPAPFGTERVELPPRTRYTLLEQLDLERIETRDGLVVYRNVSWIPMVASMPPGLASNTVSPVAPEVADDSLQQTAGNFGKVGPLHWSGLVEPDTEVYVGTNGSPDWHMVVNERQSERQPGIGWANAFSANEAGAANISFTTPLMYRLIMIGQLLGWVLVIGFLVFGRFRRGKR